MRKLIAGLLPALVALAACGGAAGSPEARGEQLYQEKLCSSCHTVDGSQGAGPTWKGLYGSTVTLADGSTLTADENYLRESMLQPGAKTVEGFPPGLMESVVKPDSLSPGEVAALIAYIRSLE